MSASYRIESLCGSIRVPGTFSYNIACHRAYSMRERQIKAGVHEDSQVVVISVGTGRVVSEVYT